jgi:DNA gyrase subunit B
VSRGKSEQYLKDERSLEDHLINQGLEEAALALVTGEVRAGSDLHQVLENARSFRHVMNSLHPRYNRAVVEQAAIAGALAPGLLIEEERAAAIAAIVAERLNLIAEQTERGWVGEADGSGFKFTRTVRGVKEVAVLDATFVSSAEARRLDSLAAELQEVHAEPATLRRRGVETVVYGPMDLFDAVTDAGRKGISLQRYKGLGEMNAEQLWETTLDVNARSLLQVKVKEVADADDLFNRLMGDVVEPRREFIQDNALRASVDV